MNKEITVKSEKIFEGKIINLRVDTVELQNKKYAKREIVEHRGACAIIAINDKDELLLVKQYRKSIEDYTIELPAGKIDLSEDPIDCAYRELNEETGFKANNMIKVFEFYSSPGFSNEKIHLYITENIIFTETHLDEDECIDVIMVNREKAKEMINSSQIIDSKTLIGILYWLNRLSLQEL